MVQGKEVLGKWGAEERFRSLRRHLPDFRPAIVFDVGANVGQSTAGFSREYPGAAIYAFEPVTTTYQALLANVETLPRVQTFNLALGRRSGPAYVTTAASSTSNHVIDARTAEGRADVESVAMTSGDAFCDEHHVERIGFLKIDTEGHDLEALAGFQRKLADMRIDFVEAEVGMTRRNRKQVAFEDVKSFLETIGYHLFSIHTQSMAPPSRGRITLSWANAIFVSDAFVEARRAAGTAAAPLQALEARPQT